MVCLKMQYSDCKQVVGFFRFFLNFGIEAKSGLRKGVISNNILTFVKTNQKLIFLLICHGQRIENLLHQYR